MQGEGARPVARVGERVLTSEDVLAHLLRTSGGGPTELTLRQQVLAALNQLIVRTVIATETERHGIRVPMEVLAQERTKALEELKLHALKAYGMGATPERFTQLEYKQPLDAWLAARDEDVRERWLLHRLVRFDGIRADRVELQVILVDDEALATELVSKLDSGADMSALAIKHSLHETARRGGRMPPMARESLAPAIADRAFGLLPGQRTGVLSVDDGTGRRQFEIVRLLRRIPPRDLQFAEASAEIEASLATEPLSALEFLAWNLRMERLYNVWIDGTL